MCCTWPHDSTWEKDHKNSGNAKENHSHVVQAKTKPFIGTVVVEIHSQTCIDFVNILLTKLVLFSESTNGQNTSNGFRKVVNNRSFGDRIKASQFPRRCKVIFLQTRARKCQNALNILFYLVITKLYTTWHYPIHSQISTKLHHIFGS